MTRGSAVLVDRPPAVAGAFYPAGADRLRALVRAQLAEADRRAGAAELAGVARPVGILVPHAGLEYSGVVAAAAWRLVATDAQPDVSAAPEGVTIVILGTNHRAAWLDGLGAWDRGAWRTPLGAVWVDADLAAGVVSLGPPFTVDLEAHLLEHSIEVQLPFVQEIAPVAMLVPLAVATGVGAQAIEAGTRLGRLLAARREAGDQVVLAISSDMAHYPAADDAEAVTNELAPLIAGLDPEGLAVRERALRERAAFGRGIRGLACGMCGIEPTVVGLAALRAMGATHGTSLAAGTSADAGGPADRTVGYLAVRFD